MKIALVNPAERRTAGYHRSGSRMPQLGLQVLAELVPAPHTVDIIDETFNWKQTDTLLQPGNYDLVGVTAYTSGATRAYEIAAFCRSRGIPCIMGGPHAWACPDEAAEHFDAIAVGECDEIWPGIIEDAAARRMKPRYEGGWPDLSKGLGRARQNMHPINGEYEINCIQTSRGCPVGCEYCSVTLFNGPIIRRRPIEDIIDEWNNTTSPFLFVTDDNFFGVSSKQAEWTKELLRAIIRHGKKRYWFSQTTINMGGDAEALRLAARAGCVSMLVGFESFNPENLEECHKKLNSSYVDRYKEMIDGFHKAGISVLGAFIIGQDHDTEDTVSETLLQAVQMGVDVIQITNMTPLPGTKMYRKYMDNGRIFATDYPGDWERYTFTETVYHPRLMTAHQLDQTMYEMRRAAATKSWIWKRTLNSFWRTRSLSTAIFVHSTNKKFAHMARMFVPADSRRFGNGIFSPEREARLKTALALRS